MPKSTCTGVYWQLIGSCFFCITLICKCQSRPLTDVILSRLLHFLQQRQVRAHVTNWDTWIPNRANREMNIGLTKKFALLCLCLCAVHADEELSQKRFEYQFSFKGPHLTQPDQTVPFWDLMGDVVPGDEQVRLVPSIRDKKGLIWSKNPFPYDSWEVVIHLRIEGRGKMGADGLVI